MPCVPNSSNTNNVWNQIESKTRSNPTLSYCALCGLELIDGELVGRRTGEVRARVRETLRMTQA